MKNPAIECIHGRRSIRSYEDRPVPADVLDEIIAAGQMAPSGCNAQAWRFVVVTDPAFLKQLAELAKPRYQQWLEMAPPSFQALRQQIDTIPDPVYYGAPAVIFVVGWGMTADPDSAMVCQNMMLAAHSLGLGSCWVYFGQLVLDDPGVREALELKPEEKVYGPILLGYPTENQPARPPKNQPTVKIV